jgi:tRNA(Ile)-lysidine synthase
VEAWAREQRYRLITELLQTGDVVLTAHHQDDQAETVLLQLLRGAGPKGLSAMAEQSPLGKGYLLRPMLNVPRATIKNYALAYQLQWVDDDSNDSLRFDRNYLRQQVIPLLQARWPAVTKVLSRAADNCREMSEVLAEPMALYLQQVQITTDSLSVGALLALNAAKRHLVLQNWLQGFGCEISREQLLLIEQQVLLARIDAEPCLQLARLSIRRFDQKLYAVPPLSSIPVGYDQAWDGTQALYIPGLAEPLTKPCLAAQGLDVEALDWKQVRVKFRQGGERCKPKGRAHSQSLKRLLQEYRIAPWLRDRLPLIYCDDQLVMVVGAWVCA